MAGSLTVTKPAPAVNQDARGKFVKGNAAAAGKRGPSELAKLRAALYETAKPADVRAITETLIKKAKSGEAWAVTLALKYLVGEPERAVSVTHGAANSLVLASTVGALVANNAELERQLAADEEWLPRIHAEVIG